MEPDPAAMLLQADAALLIGDPALRVTLKAEALMSKLPSSEICCGGDPGEQPVPGVDTLFLYDVAYQWREMTGRPCVLALWVARREAATPAVVADFLASREYRSEEHTSELQSLRHLVCRLLLEKKKKKKKIIYTHTNNSHIQA